MSSIDRQHRLLALVNCEGRQTITALAERFAVSVQTIRTDIRTLAGKGLVLRRHGEVLPFPDYENVAYDQRRIVNATGKRRIAQRCLELIGDNQSLFLGTGTTVEQLAASLTVREGLQIMTNNLHAVRHLCHHPSCQLTVAGGRVRQRDQDIIGGDAWRFFERYRVDVGVVSVGAMDRWGRLYDYNDDEVMAREGLVANARLTAVLIDSTKFDTRASCNAGTVADYDVVITDEPLPRALRSTLGTRAMHG